MSEHNPASGSQPILPTHSSTHTASPQPQVARSKKGPQAKAGAVTAEPKDSVREIVETVVFVVVLVLLLKSFVAEAFVIPTGSMAETLYGYQKIVSCPKCGYKFPVNCSNEVDPQQGPPTQVTGCTCPNCRYEIVFREENMDPSPNTGDRVLVAKFVYDLDLLGMNNMPKRFDVVVFKYPEGPQKAFTPMNYIKRLVGLPRETIAIHYGKLYVYEGLDYDRDDRDVPAKDLWRYTHGDDQLAKELFGQGRFRILRKPPQQVLSEKRLVYDNDHQPEDLAWKVPPRWQPEPGAKAATPDNPKAPRLFRYAANLESQMEWIRYSHLIPGSDRLHVRKELITDFMGYNTWKSHDMRHDLPPQNWVGDLTLECEVQLEQAQGELVLELSKGTDRFRARWDLTTGMCTLWRLADRKEEKLDSKETSLKKPGKYRLRFANVDERLAVWVDSSMPFGDGHPYEPPRWRGPTEENDLEPASIGVSGNVALAISGLKLWRDTYYTTNLGRHVPDAGQPIDYGRPADWKVLGDLQPKTMYVQPNHFLCLGDNSPESSDGRSWGLVPHRLLLGRALMIYYPFQIPFVPWGSPRAGPIH